MLSLKARPHAAWFAVGAALLLVVVLRLHRLDLPLERDEGEYAYGAQLILRGEFSYDALRTMKLPGAHLALAPFLAVLGETPEAMRAALLAFDAGSVILLFLLARRFVGPWAAAGAAASLALLQASRSVLGLFAHVENFALLPVLAGLLLAVRAARGGGARVWLGSGLALGLAVLMKQPAAVFGALALGGALYAARAAGPRALVPRAALFVLGGALPYGLVSAWMAASGHFEAFWFTTVTYAREYGSDVSLREGLGLLGSQLSDVWSLEPAFTVLALVGIAGLALRRDLRAAVAPFAGLALAGAVATSVGLYFRAHYFVLLLPAAAVAAALGADSLGAWLGRAGRARAAVAAAALLAALGWGGWREREVLWTGDPLAVSRQIYYPNPFAESAALAELIRQRTQPGDTIAVLGSEPQIAFLSGRRSATGFVYMYPLMERHAHAAWMQERAIQEIEAAQPRVLLFVDVGISWLRRTGSVSRILEWYPDYARRDFELIGVLDLASPAGSRWLDARTFAQEGRRLPSFVAVYQRAVGR